MLRKNLYRSTILVLFLLLLIWKNSAAAGEETASNELYRKGIEALKAKDTLRAELLFKESIRENSDAPSHFELAKILVKRNTFISRNRAFENFQVAVWKDPDNIEYKYQFAELCKDFARFTAIDEYKKILMLDSTQINAWINLGAIKEKDFTEFDRSFRNMDGILAPLQEYADEDLQEAEKFYKNALSIDSSNYDASLKLSLLYEKASTPEKGIPLLKRLTEAKKDDEKVHLSLGLLYYKTSNLKESFKEYKKALSMMAFDEQKDFTINSVKSLLEPLFDDVMKKMSDEELENFIDLFWKVSEPLYLTDYNERLIEHYSRVAYSNLHFSVPKMGIVGWKSNRGEVLLRYGEPLNRMRMRPQMEAKSVAVKTDVWNYKDFTLGFTDMAQSGNFVFSAPAAEKDKLASQFVEDTQTFMENLRKGYFSSYDPKFEGPKFDLSYSIAQFKNYGIRNHSEVVVSYALDAADSLLVSGRYKIEHDAGIFFFNKNYEELEKKIVRIENFDASKDLVVTPSNRILVNTVDIPMRTDSGFIAVEIRRNADNSTSANRSRIRIRKFSTDKLDISDLILASRVEHEKFSDRALNRKNLFIQPNPSNQFDANLRPWLYYEIYNLGLGSDGMTDIEQRIVVSEFNEEESFNAENVFKSVLEAIGISKEKDKISLTSGYKTRERDPQIYLQLDLGKYPAGKYLIAVLITDKITGRTTETKSVIDWKN